MMPFSIFGFRALWSPYFFLALVLLVVLYFLLTKKWRHWFEGTEPVTKRETNYFLLAMVLLYIVKGSPLDLIGHILFSVHMTQMALLLLAVAPLMIMGIPDFIWKKVFSVKIIDNIVRLLTKPIISLMLFTIAFSMYHYPMILDYIKLSAAFTRYLYDYCVFSSIGIMVADCEYFRISSTIAWIEENRICNIKCPPSDTCLCFDHFRRCTCI